MPKKKKKPEILIRLRSENFPYSSNSNGRWRKIYAGLTFMNIKIGLSKKVNLMNFSKIYGVCYN
jgi:hypothetical protein